MFGEKNLAKVLAISLILVVGIGAVVFLSPKVSAESKGEANVAYVNMQKVLQKAFEKHPKKLKVEEQFNQEVKKMQQQLKTELETKLNDVSGEEKQRLVNSYDRKFKEQVARREQQLIQSVMQEIENTTIKQAIEKVANEEEVAIVLEKQAVIYGGKDITDQVLKKVEDELKSKSQAEDNN